MITRDLVLAFIEETEIAFTKPRGKLKLTELGNLQKAADLFRLEKQLGALDEVSQQQLKALGGRGVYTRLSQKMAEYIVVKESPEERIMKDRPAKDAQKNEHYWLLELHKLLRTEFEKEMRAMKKSDPQFDLSTTTLEHISHWLNKGEILRPTAMPDELLVRYERNFRNLDHELKRLHPKLGRFRPRVREFDTKIVGKLGPEGLQKEWAQLSFLSERLILEKLGRTDNDKLIFRDSFLKKIAKDDDPSGDEKSLYNYLKTINAFLFEINSSPKQSGIPEMQLALDYRDAR